MDDLVCPACKEDHSGILRPGKPALELLACKCGWVRPGMTEAEERVLRAPKVSLFRGVRDTLGATK